MPHALDRLDADFVAAPTGDDDVAAHVLEVERAVLAQAQRFRELVGVLVSATDLVTPPPLGFAGSLGLTARSLGRLARREDGDLLHLDVDLPGLLLDGALDLVDDVVEM